MAGIGFVLRKLAREDTLLGPLSACIHSAVLATGPWIVTILTVTGLLWCGGVDGSNEIVRLVIMYNFSLSLILVSPISIVVSRVLGDKVYFRDLRGIAGVLIGGTVLTQIVIALFGFCLYGVVLDLTPAQTLIGYLHFALIGQIWLVTVFLSTLRAYWSVSFAFVVGLLVTCGVGAFAAGTLGSAGMLTACDLGLGATLTILVAATIREYPVALTSPWMIFGAMREHWVLALGTCLFQLGMWADKLVMWGAPEAIRTNAGFLTYPSYESAMFLANLTVIPAMAAFIFNIETEFHERYLRFYEDLSRHATLRAIRANHSALLGCIGRSWRNFSVVQGSVSLMLILCAPKLFGALNLQFLELSIFRFGVFGSVFFVLVLFVCVFLTYFEARSKLLIVQSTFLVSNLLLTWWSRELGFAFYGYGFFLSSLATFAVGAMLTAQHLFELPFHTFISNNSALRASRKALRVGT